TSPTADGGTPPATTSPDRIALHQAPTSRPSQPRPAQRNAPVTEFLIDSLITPFSVFACMHRTLAGGLTLALGATPVGVFLLLRRMSLMGDAMSHAILPGAALGYLAFGLSLGAMTVGGIVAGLVVVLAAGVVTRASILKEDASLAAFYLLSLAAGVMIVSLRGQNLDLLHVLFGSVLGLDDASLLLIASIASVT